MADDATVETGIKAPIIPGESGETRESQVLILALHLCRAPSPPPPPIFRTIFAFSEVGMGARRVFALLRILDI
ncbi:hypothetical protein DY000_02008086 [Brassica cretica]|uniref:Uncharacterized protein n=1 Tax=Brassica cretica TaxID=69181 RepID=A0ABQ7BYD7_BRACR|nr:hypothetical protein DY000_02008086 [Brassica cretica]